MRGHLQAAAASYFSSQFAVGSLQLMINNTSIYLLK